MSTYFCLHASCIPVKGHKRSTLYDIQRDRYILIPNALSDVLSNEAKDISVDQEVENIEDDEMVSWFEHLYEKEYGFFTHDKALFRNLKMIDLMHCEPCLIKNAIIDFGKGSNHNIEAVFQELSTLHCEALELRFFYPVTIEEIEKILQNSYNTNLQSIEILLPFHESLAEIALKELFVKYFRVHKVTVYLHHNNLLKEVEKNRFLHFTSGKVDSASHCSVVSPAFFNASIQQFSESNRLNSCLNGKIAIDMHGDIKNCPSFSKSYGKYGQKTLVEVTVLNEFIKDWGVSQDETEICKDCEFRYMCVDCRGKIENKDNVFSKPAKCCYNPYTAKWES